MGYVTCEKTGKCPTGMIASTGLDGLADILEAYKAAEESVVEITISVKSSNETNSYSFDVKNIAEMVEMLRMTTGR